jgi:hypothetical protein
MESLNTSREESVDRYLRVIREMNTFVCESCYKEELCTHPQLGRSRSTEWYKAMAELAKAQGWSMLSTDHQRKTWFFVDFMVMGPECAMRLNGAG